MKSDGDLETERRPAMSTPSYFQCTLQYQNSPKPVEHFGQKNMNNDGQTQSSRNLQEMTQQKQNLRHCFKIHIWVQPSDLPTYSSKNLATEIYSQMKGL